MTQTSLSTPSPVLERYTRPCLATVYVPTPSGVEDARDQRDINIRRVGSEVADIAGEDARKRLEVALRTHDPHAGSTLVAVIGEDPDDVVVWDTGVEMPARAVGGPLPALTDLLIAQQRWLPHVVVLVDRVGADLTVVSGRHDVAETAVDGGEMHITKSHPGGWSQRRFQQRAEDQWEDNARLVATHLDTIVREGDIELVLLAGDVEMRTRLQDDLPDAVAKLVRTIDTGGRAEDGSEAHLEAAIDAEVRRVAAERREAATRIVMDAVGRGDGVQGREDVLATLFQARVDTLVLRPAAAEGLWAHIGPDPGQVAADSSVLHDLGTDAQRVPLADAALRAAAATGASVVLLDEIREHEGQDAEGGEVDRLEVEAFGEDATPAAEHAQLPDITDGVAASLRGDWSPRASA